MLAPVVSVPGAAIDVRTVVLSLAGEGLPALRLGEALGLLAWMGEWCDRLIAVDLPADRWPAQAGRSHCRIGATIPCPIGPANRCSTPRPS